MYMLKWDLSAHVKNNKRSVVPALFCRQEDFISLDWYNQRFILLFTNLVRTKVNKVQE